MLLLEGHRMREDTTEEDENKQRLDPLKAGDGVLEAEEYEKNMIIRVFVPHV